MKRYLILFVFTFSFISVVTGQNRNRNDDENLVQLTGRLLNELLQPLPYAHVLILNNYRGTITDQGGKYSLVASENDSVMFSTLGYKRHIMVVPNNLDDPFINMDIILETDTFMISEVEIYPWKSYEEFKEAFLNLKLPDSDMDRARRNIALLKTQIILDETPSARANFQYIFEQQYRQTYTQGTLPSYQIFNAFAWKEFFEALKRGDFLKYGEENN